MLVVWPLLAWNFWTIDIKKPDLIGLFRELFQITNVTTYLGECSVIIGSLPLLNKVQVIKNWDCQQEPEVTVNKS